MADVVADLREAWRRTDAIFDVLDGAWLERPIPLRHPFVFYLGHLPAFAWNQVARGVLGLPAFRREYDELFERGIDPLDETAAVGGHIHDWPALEDVLAYRDAVRAALLELPEALDAREGDPLAEGRRVLHLVLEHEHMHHETLAYMLQMLPPQQKRRPSGAGEPVPGDAPRRELVSVPPGAVSLGTDLERVPFAWDNEIPARRVEVAGFELDRYPVTVESYRAFVEAGGYREPHWWRQADWRWIQGHAARHPLHWREEGGRWLRRTMFGSVELDRLGGWPVIVSEAEAQAYARWRGARLPTEPELRWATTGTPDGAERAYPWGDEPPDPTRGNFDFAHHDPTPVDAHPAGASAFGVGDLVGNGWEWTDTTFAPHAGFEPWARTYPGYSVDFFDGQHSVLLGGAWPTSARLLRGSFRNWFQRHYPWVFATFRCVEG